MHRQRTGSGWQWLVCASLLMSAFIIRGNAEAAATYVGEAVCGSGCHLGKHEGWVQTAHQQILMDGASEYSYINDGNQSGRSEFFDGGRFPVTSLPGGDAFAAFGASAPILGRNATLGPYVQIGTAKYPVVYALGGSAVQNPTVADTDPADGRILNREAQWKQLYITQIGPSHYVLPIQFNAKTNEYVPYNTSEWYDQANVPLAKASLRIGPTSYERRCAGCHSTGVKVRVEPDERALDHELLRHERRLRGLSRARQRPCLQRPHGGAEEGDHRQSGDAGGKVGPERRRYKEHDRQPDRAERRLLPVSPERHGQLRDRRRGTALPQQGECQWQAGPLPPGSGSQRLLPHVPGCERLLGLAGQEQQRPRRYRRARRGPESQRGAGYGGGYQR